MNITEASTNRRTVRSFYDDTIAETVLREICEVSRLYASSANLQPIRFKIVNDKAICDAIFQYVHLAGYIPDYRVTSDEQPPAYILLLTKKNISENPQFDAGAAATNIMLLAKEHKMDTCCIDNFSKKRL